MMMKDTNKKNKNNKLFPDSLYMVAVCAVVMGGTLFSCSSYREPKTMRLFMQSQRVNIELPHEEGGRSGILSEQVSFPERPPSDRKSTRLNSSHANISYAVFCLKKKKLNNNLDYIR